MKCISSYDIKKKKFTPTRSWFPQYFIIPFLVDLDLFRININLGTCPKKDTQNI